jgi:ferrous iron transport protein B
VCFGIRNLINTEELEMIEGAGSEVAVVMGISKIAALAYLMFNLFSPPCFAAIGAMNAEMKSLKWLFGGIALQLGMGYTISYLVYTIGTLIISPESLNLVGAIVGFAIVLACVFSVVALSLKNRKKV